MNSYKGYAFVNNGIVSSVHYYDLAIDTSPQDNHPQVFVIPEDKLNAVFVGWKYENGEFSQ